MHQFSQLIRFKYLIAMVTLSNFLAKINTERIDVKKDLVKPMILYTVCLLFLNNNFINSYLFYEIYDSVFRINRKLAEDALIN